MRVRARACLCVYVCVCEREREREREKEREREGGRDRGGRLGGRERESRELQSVLYSYKEKILGEYLYLQSVIANLHTTPPTPQPPTLHLPKTEK